MEYSVKALARLAGISSRTLRYYDEIGLLSPLRRSTNGYRVYTQKEVDRLQQILFYRELDVALEDIKSILSSENHDDVVALEAHLEALHTKREQIDALIANVQKTIMARKGEVDMSDEEKFEGFKQKMVEENERLYGEEIREKYGDDVVDASYAKVSSWTKAQHEEVEKLSQELNETLKAAFEQGDPASELAQKTCELHKTWLCCYWDSYSKEAHKGVTQMYVDDPRFTAYYDDIAPGCAPFLRDAVAIFCK